VGIGENLPQHGMPKLTFSLISPNLQAKNCAAPDFPAGVKQDDQKRRPQNQGDYGFNINHFNAAIKICSYVGSMPLWECKNHF
jgi:hypothetical protein